VVKTKSVRLGEDVIETLKQLKIHPRETYDDVIRRLIEAWKKSTQSK
jgi:predicted CopG family antitoxin